MLTSVVRLLRRGKGRGDRVGIFDELRDQVRRFSEARDWLRYHTPKNLAMALVGEAGELAAEFQWLTAEESFIGASDQEAWSAVQGEMADVFIYLLRLSDVLAIDLEVAVRAKLDLNERRFPIGD